MDVATRLWLGSRKAQAKQGALLNNREAATGDVTRRDKKNVWRSEGGLCRQHDGMTGHRYPDPLEA